MKLSKPLIFLTSLLLTACSATTAAPAVPTVVIDSPTQASASITVRVGGGVTASGIVVPVHEVKMGFPLGGRLNKVNFSAGEEVQAGQVLAELDNAAIRMELEQAQRTLREMTSPASLAAAAQDLAIARQTLKDAQDKVNNKDYPRASETLIDNTKGEIDLARQQLAKASDNYKSYTKLPDGDTKKAAALVAMTDAQLRLNTLIAKYNWYSGKASDVDAALADANLEAAKSAVQEAEWYITALQGEQLPDEATGRNLARLQAANDALLAAQERLDQTRLISPIQGTVAAVKRIAGETVSPGEIIFMISNLAHLRIETTDLSERNVADVKEGQTVTVTIKALKMDVTGRVASISLIAETLGGDVVYRTTIELDKTPPGLRAGMSVDVLYNTEQ